MEVQASIPQYIQDTSAMYDYTYVLEQLRVSAAGHRRSAPSGPQSEIANKTTERTLRNRALAIVKLLQGMAEAQRRAFVEAAIRHL
jgi:hypothetical protein